MLASDCNSGYETEEDNKEIEVRPNSLNTAFLKGKPRDGYEFVKFVIYDGDKWTSRMAEREIAPAHGSAVSSFKRMDPEEIELYNAQYNSEMNDIRTARYPKRLNKTVGMEFLICHNFFITRYLFQYTQFSNLS